MTVIWWFGGGGVVASHKIKKYPNARSVRVFINFVYSKLKVNCACTLMNCINATLMEIHAYITFIVIHLATFYWLYDKKIIWLKFNWYKFMHTKLFIFLCIHLPYYMSIPKQWKINMNTVETIFCFSKLFFYVL